MSAESPKSNSHEEFFKLLFGLLDEDKADELRTLIATDSDVAKEYDETLKFVDLTARAIRIERTVNSALAGDEVIDFRSFERASGFAFDAASGSFEDGVFRQSERRKRLKIDKSEESADGSKARKNPKRIKSKKQRSEKDLVANQPNTSNRSFYESFFFQTIKNIVSKKFDFIGGAGVFFRNLSLFKKLVFAIVLFGIIISISLVWQEIRLRRFFNEDYYVRTAVPDVLVRGVPQSIVVLTRNILNEPHRVSVRFDLVDASTNDFVLSHSEWSNAEGLVCYDLTNTESFPEKVKLKVSVGTKNDFCFERVLQVVNSNGLTIGSMENCFPTTSPLSEIDSEKRLFASYVGREITKRKLEERLPVRAYDDIQKQPEEQNPSDGEKTASTCVFIRIYPELGRLITGFPNTVGVFCTDSLGRPISDRFTLSDDEELVSFETDEMGYGAFAFTPLDGRHYFLSNDSSRKVTLIENQADFRDEKTSMESTVVEKENSDLSDIESGEETKDDGVALNGARLSISNNSNVYFRPLKSIFREDESIELELSSTSKESLIATIDKNGSLVSQRLIDVSDGKKIVSIPLLPQIGGLLKIAVYKVIGNESLQRVGEKYVFRDIEGGAPRFTSEWCANENEVADSSDEIKKNRLVVSIERRIPFFEKGRRKEFVAYDELPMTLDACWMSDIDRVCSATTLDDALSECSDPLREKVLSTSCCSRGASPVLVDNLRQVKSSASSKLEDFRKKEAKTVGRIASFGLLVCAALVVWSFFWVVFDALSIWRSLVVTSLACVLGLFICLEPKTLDYSAVLATSLGFVENQTLSSDESWDYLECFERDFSDRVESESHDTEILSYTRKVGPGETVIDIGSLGVKKDDSSGFVFIRVTDDKRGTWTVIPWPDPE